LSVVKERTLMAPALQLICALLLETVAAVHWLVTARLERHFGRAATARACRGEHLALAAAKAAPALTATTGCAAGLASRSAIGATVGLVLKALLCVEFLLACSKCKLRAAIDAR
jgi:hypothetical protein